MCSSINVKRLHCIGGYGMIRPMLDSDWKYVAELYWLGSGTIDIELPGLYIVEVS